MQYQRRLDIRTLAIASLASAGAAALTSQFWIKGTPIAAAVTPVIVALISEMLHRPTERITQRLAADAGTPMQAAGATGPPPAEQGEAAPGPEGAPQPAIDSPVRVYRNGRGRRLALGAALVTGALAFATAALALSVPELITGNSLFNSDRRTTLGGAKLAPQSDPAPNDNDRTGPQPAPPDDGPTERPRQRQRQPPQQRQQQPQQQQRQEQSPTPERAPPPTTTTPTEGDEEPSARTLDPPGAIAPGGGAAAPVAQ